jgi:tRNA(Ile)-lysidine synthase TilS/MesJ
MLKLVSRNVFNFIQKNLTSSKFGILSFGKQKRKYENDISALKPIQNKYYEEIKKICKANNINLIAVMTPIQYKGVGLF